MLTLRYRLITTAVMLIAVVGDDGAHGHARGEGHERRAGPTYIGGGG